jgi:hypothetical protein
MLSRTSEVVDLLQPTGELDSSQYRDQSYRLGLFSLSHLCLRKPTALLPSRLLLELLRTHVTRMAVQTSDCRMFRSTERCCVELLRESHTSAAKQAPSSGLQRNSPTPHCPAPVAFHSEAVNLSSIGAEYWSPESNFFSQRVGCC